jgi:hypothetical protein
LETYIKNPFDLSARGDFLDEIALTCIDKKKTTKPTLPYALALQHLTMNVGQLTNENGWMIDVRHYNGYLTIPGSVYHLSSKWMKGNLHDCFGKTFELDLINFIMRLGYTTQKCLSVRIHEAYINYIKATAQKPP